MQSQIISGIHKNSKVKNFNVYDQENKAVQEAYALLMANVHFNNTVKTVTIASCMPEAGKTTTAINLAISMARAGWRTLLVDADVRKPGNVKRISSEITQGLSEIIEGNAEATEVLHATNIVNLEYLSSGKNNANPIELLCSASFDSFVEEIKGEYDFVVFDTPTLSSVIDGALVASKTDATLLVAEIGATKLTTLKRSKEQLEKANANTIGVVLNKVKKRDYLKYVEAYNYFSDVSKFGKKKKKSK